MVMITEGIPKSPSSNGTPRRANQADAHAACRFYVEIGKSDGGREIQAVFTELGGLQVEMQVTDYEEGGTNNFIHRLPGRLKVGNITLKRGLTRSNDFLRWCMRAALEKPMDRRNVSVVLFDVKGKPVVRWNFMRAFPVKWVGPQFTADSTTMAIESVELAHEGLTVESL
jgi:phage tail-like protein